MMKYYIFSFCLFISCFSFSQFPRFQWMKAVLPFVEHEGQKIVSDEHGGVYTCTYLYLNNQYTDIHPGIDSSDFIGGQGMSDRTVIHKLNENGDLLWHVVLPVKSYDIAVDTNTGNLYFTGSFNETVDFDPGSNSHNLTSTYAFGTYHNDIFILSLDSSGAFRWVHKFGGNTNESGHSVAVDYDGNVIFTGRFKGTRDFHPSGINMLSAPNDYGIFVEKLDSNGNYIWAKAFAGNGNDQPWDIAIDPWNSISIIARFSDVINFDPGNTNFSITPTSLADVLTFKLDENGNFKWANSWRNNFTRFEDYAFSIVNDSEGNVITTGVLDLLYPDMDPGPGVVNPTGKIFVLKLDSVGDFVWLKSLGTTLGVSDGGYDVATDQYDNIYLTGKSESADLDMDPGPDTVIFQFETNAENSFILKLNPVGEYQWAISLGDNVGSGNSIQIPKSIFVTNDDVIYHSGTTFGTGDFDPGLDTFYYTPPNQAVYFVKLNQCYVSTSSSISISECGQYHAPDNSIIDSSGIYQIIIPNSVGCDSIITIDLEIIDISSSLVVSSDTIYADTVGVGTLQWINCDLNFAIQGALNDFYIPQISGNYALIIADSLCSDTSNCVFINMCPTLFVDVIYYLQPTIGLSNGSISVTSYGGMAPYSYSWLYNLSVDSVQTNMSSGLYEVNVTDGSGCSGGRYIPLYHSDTSLVNNPIIDTLSSDTMDICVPFNFITYSIYDWHINPLDTAVLLINWVFQDSLGNVFITEVPYDIDTNFSEGNIFAILNMDCISGLDNKVNEFNSGVFYYSEFNNSTLSFPQYLKSDFRLYPNPTEGLVYIDALKNSNNYQVVVRSSLGQIVDKFHFNNYHSELYLKGENGIYFLEIISDDVILSYKVIKQR